MIYGTGVDIVANKRIMYLLSHYNERFYRQFLREEEVVQFEQYRDPIHLGGIFAGKEAVIKAFSGIGVRLSFQDVTIARTLEGLPYAMVKRLTLQDKSLHISISHEVAYSVASAVLSD